MEKMEECLQMDNSSRFRKVDSLQEGSTTFRTDLEKKKQLRFSDILYGMRRHTVLIIICTVVGMAFGIILSFISYARGEMSKQYAIKTSINIITQNKSGKFVSDSEFPDSSDFHLAEDMVDSVIYVLQSDRMLNAVVERLDILGIGPKDISNNLSMSQYKETQIIEVTLYWRTAQEGIEILEALNAVAPGILIDTLKIGSVSVINPPRSRYLIGGNINAALWGYMMVLGMMAGIGFSILDLLLRPTLLNTSDVENDFHIEVLGEIPDKSRYFRKKRNILMANPDDDLNTDVLDNYMSLAYILKSRIQKMKHPCIYVTSAAQNEGKTTVTAYLASFLAELGMKVLLIDCDVRNPRLGGLFLSNVEYAHSVNALYRGESEKEDAITSLTGNLDILPAVLERLTMPFDDAMHAMIQNLKPEYDVVLLDTAPVGKVADTMGLNGLADLALLVIRFDGTGLEVIRDAIVRLDKSGIRIMGCVVNGVKNLRKERGSYGSYGRYTSSVKSGKKKQKSSQAIEWEEWEREQQEKEKELKAIREQKERSRENSYDKSREQDSKEQFNGNLKSENQNTVIKNSGDHIEINDIGTSGQKERSEEAGTDRTVKDLRETDSGDTNPDWLKKKPEDNPDNEDPDPFDLPAKKPGVL